MEAETDLRPLRVLRVFSIPKRQDTGNEDHACVSDDGSICAVSDGASISFDSGRWAEILARRFVSNQDISKLWIEAAIQEYRSTHDREAMSWAYQAAFDRGSFATLLGIVCAPDGRGVRTFALGDTLLAFTDSGKVLLTLPYLQTDEFDKSPSLISTNPLENNSLDDETLWYSWRVLTVASHDAPKLLLMTDAIGRWLLEQRDSDRASQLLDIPDEAAFASFVDRERAEGRMKRDDSTLVVVG
jgi:Protein phosphatase 2C